MDDDPRISHTQPKTLPRNHLTACHTLEMLLLETAVSRQEAGSSPEVGLVQRAGGQERGAPSG